jgi:hypothetical protein
MTREGTGTCVPVMWLLDDARVPTPVFMLRLDWTDTGPFTLRSYPRKAVPFGQVSEAGTIPVAPPPGSTGT